MNKCLNCAADLIQIEGKREKKFCNSTCRSNYWQKEKVKLKYQNRIEDWAAGRLTDSDMEKMKRIPIEFTKPMHEKAKREVFDDIIHTGIAITKSDTDGNIERIDPMSYEGWKVQEQAKIQERISQIEEMLNMPPKYLPKEKRTKLRIELSELKNQLQ